MLFYSFSDALTDLVGDIRTVEGINGTASIWATYPTAGISTVRQKKKLKKNTTSVSKLNASLVSIMDEDRSERQT